MTSGVLARLLLRHPIQPFTFVFDENTELTVDCLDEIRHETGDRIAVVTTC